MGVELWSRKSFSFIGKMFFYTILRKHGNLEILRKKEYLRAYIVYVRKSVPQFHGCQIFPKFGTFSVGACVPHRFHMFHTYSLGSLKTTHSTSNPFILAPIVMARFEPPRVRIKSLRFSQESSADAEKPASSTT